MAVHPTHRPGGYSPQAPDMAYCLDCGTAVGDRHTIALPCPTPTVDTDWGVRRPAPDNEACADWKVCPGCLELAPPAHLIGPWPAHSAAQCEPEETSHAS